MQERWNKGVELAYLLNTAIDLDPADLDYSDKLANQLEKLNWNYAFVANRQRGFAASFKEPYFTLNNLGDEVVYGALYAHEEQVIRKQKLVDALDDALNELIGREVYVQGMNPYELIHKAA